MDNSKQIRSMTEGVCKGGQNPQLDSDKRPPAPGGSGGKCCKQSNYSNINYSEINSPQINYSEINSQPYQSQPYNGDPTGKYPMNMEGVHFDPAITEDNTKTWEEILEQQMIGASKQCCSKQSQPKIKIKKLHPDAIIPTRAHKTDAGIDLYSIEDVWIPAGATLKISTGIAIQPPPGFYGKICERSSMGAKGLAIRGGVCDQPYTGEYIVCMTNTTNKGYHIQQKDKIAQVVFHQYGDFDIEEVIEFEETERNLQGFGSSGR